MDVVEPGVIFSKTAEARSLLLVKVDAPVDDAMTVRSSAIPPIRYDPVAPIPPGFCELTGVQVRPVAAVAIVVALLMKFPIRMFTETAQPLRPSGIVAATISIELQQALRPRNSTLACLPR